MPPPGGARVAGYEVIAEIGRGGMGVVYLASDESGDHVAIKTVLPAHHGDRERLAMIGDEAALTARLDHPNIVAVRELADHEGAPALVLDYVHGESLASILIECVRLTEPLVARIGADVAAALAAAAGAGVVHRDVAPQNVLIGYDGSVRLGDFGVAWAAEGREAVTAAGVVKGRVAYMAPEQLGGGAVTAAADVYALGVMLARAIAGRLPDRDAETGRDLALPPEVSGEWRELLAAVTADEPGDRIAASELAERLAARAADAAAVADLLAERFAESRELKESIIDRGSDLASSETELLDTGAGASEEVIRKRRRGPLVAIGLAAAAAIALVAMTGLGRRGSLDLEPPAIARSQGGPVCLISGPVTSAADRDPTYVAVRLVSRLIDGAIAGFRDGDRCPEGSRIVAVTGSASGRGVVIAGGREVAVSGARPAAQARAMAEVIAPGQAGANELSDHGWRRALRLLKIRELVYMARGGDKSMLDAAVREDGADLEHVYAIDAWSRWISGDLSAEHLRRPADGSPALERVLDTLLALAAGDTDAARDHAAAALEAAATAGPALALAPMIDMVAGEAAFHGGDPVAGAAAFERALAADPDLLIAIYHLSRFRMARGDWAKVEELAAHWARLDPSASSPADLQARVLVGRGDYDAALEAFDAIVRESIAGPASSAEVGRILTLAMAGRADKAAEAARAMAEMAGGEPHVVAVSPEPTGYALALWRGDGEAAAYWSARVASQLEDRWEENHIALAATMDLIDHIAGSSAAPRLAGDPPPARRRYRYRDQVAVLHLLRGRPAEARSAVVRAFAAAQALEGSDSAGAEAGYRDALAGSAEGELDCVILWKWAELARQNDLESRGEICRRLARPRVPTPLCIVARCR
jgi:tetratricopeptide (TPR) repeat protein